MEKTFSIGQLATAAGIGVTTVRFYERKKLLPVPPRRASGYRIYDQAAVRRLHFIHQAKQLGFSLAETAELLELRVRPGRTCTNVRERAVQKIADVKQKIKQLKRFERALRVLVAQCDQGKTQGECPILGALEH
jgi:MerR family copper efflux transcriptional regulator